MICFLVGWFCSFDFLIVVGIDTYTKSKKQKSTPPKKTKKDTTKNGVKKKEKYFPFLPEKFFLAAFSAFLEK